MEINLLVILDSSDKENYRIAKGTVSLFLKHFGIPYQELDLVKEESINFNASGILIAQEGLGKRMDQRTKKSLYRAVKQGTGLINLDYHLDSYKELHQPLKIERIEKEDKTSLIKIGEKHYINELHPHLLPPPLRGRIEERGMEKQLLQPLKFLKVKTKNKPLLLAEDNSPLLLCSSPKLIQFLISPRLWLPEYFGHCAGLDDILFRAIIWAVKKPFVTKTIPPFVTSRIDDANGSANIFGKRKDSANKNFAYLDMLNKFGLIPNIGLFIDDITEEDSKIIKEKYDKKLADFSPHAFSDPKNINEFPVYMHHNGKEFSKEELKENFARVDKKFQDWGIKPSKTVNAHFDEIGLNSLPFLKERGQIYTMNPIRFGKTWIDEKARDWKPKPYGDTGFNFDYMLDDPDFFNVCTGTKSGPKDYLTPSFDFLYGCTSFWKENSKNDVQKAALRGAEQIKLGLDSGFFGCLMAHEQRIAILSIKEFEEILERIDGLLSDHEKIFASYDEIAEYLYHHQQTKLKEIKIEGNKISCQLAGKSTIPLKLSIFREMRGKIKKELCNLPPFSVEVEVVL